MVVLIMTVVIVIVISTTMVIGGAIVGVVNDGSMTHGFRRRPCDLPLAHSLFLLRRALVPDLYCPGYSSAETLSKEANLMKAAGRYKVDASKMTAAVTAELSAKRKRPQSPIPQSAEPRQIETLNQRCGE